MARREKGSRSDDVDELPFIGNPARRALEAHGVTTLRQLSAWREQDLLNLHGMGPKAVRILGEALTAKKLSFAKPRT